ncbi:MAG: hypothetical protein QOK00_1339 [Thermoleophilaceae bacterium]|nr:hypothetical protein [Thermoleophilaceae bacterium]
MAFRRTLRAAFPWLPVVVLGAFVAYFRMFTSFAAYDDEGYLLVSLSEFLHGGTLYADVYTQYGPFYYLLFGGLFELAGQPVTSNAGRLIVVAIWVATATLQGMAVHRLTGRLWVGVIVQLVAFMTLELLVAEPMHPTGLVCLLTAGLLFFAARPGGSGAGVAIALGTLVAALALTKVNVGALAALAVFASAGLTLPDLRRHAALRYGVAAVLLLTPVAILGPDLDQAWVQDLLILVEGGLAAVVVTALWSPGPEGMARGVRWVLTFAGVAVAVGLTIAAVTIALGTSGADLVEGVLFEPARLRRVFMLPFSLPKGVVDWSIAAVAVAILVRALPAWEGRLPSPWTAAFRIVAAFATLAAVTASLPLTIGPDFEPLLIPVLLAWLAVAPARGVTRSPWEAFARTFFVLLAVLETLQVYPVAGTQTKAAALLFVPVGGLLLADGLRQLESVGSLEAPALRRWTVTVGVVVLAAIGARFAVDGLVRPGQGYARAYFGQDQLRVAGADLIRLPPREAGEYARFVARIRDSCDTFITLPGLNSFYLWTDQRPPTGLSPGDWMLLLDDEQQQRIVDAVRDENRLCLVRSDGRLYDWLVHSGGVGEPAQVRPLMRFIEQTQWQEIDHALGRDYLLFVRPSGSS